MGLEDKTEFDDLLTLIKDTNEHIEEKLRIADSATNNSNISEMERTEKSLQFMSELLAHYEAEDERILVSFKYDHCDIQPPLYSLLNGNFTLTPWWWKDLRDGEEAVDVLNNLFKKWMDSFPDRNLLSTALVALKTLGNQVKERKHVLQEKFEQLRAEAGEDPLSGLSDEQPDSAPSSAWLWETATTGLSFLQMLVVGNTANAEQKKKEEEEEKTLDV